MRLWVILPYYLLVQTGSAQSIEMSDELGSLIGESLDQITTNDQSDQVLLSEDLTQVNLNNASKEDLKSIPWLSPLQIQSLLDYIGKNGPLVSIYELQAIPGWDLATIQLTEPLVLIREKGEYHDKRKVVDRIHFDGGLDFMIRVKRRLEISDGFLNSGSRKFQGSPNYWLCRFSYRAHGSFRFGINMEKDAGERFVMNPKAGLLGPDYLSGYFQLENKGVLKRLILGDFEAQWDQGLLLGRRFNLGQQVITSPRKVHSGFVAHTGSRENGYFHGIGLTLGISNADINLFYSRRALDTIVEDAASGDSLPVRATSILETGLHRTDLELDRKKNLWHQVIGINFRHHGKNGFSSSVSALYSTFELSLIPRANRYNQTWFQGKTNFNYSGAFEYVGNNFNLYGQIGVSANKGWGSVVGIIANLSHKFETSIHLRKINPDFHSIAGEAFTVSSSGRDEQGVYWGLKYTPNYRWVIGTSLNLFKNHWLSFSSDYPSSGLQHLVRLQYVPAKHHHLHIYWKSKVQLENSKSSSAKLTRDIDEVAKHSLGLRLKWSHGARLVSFSTIQYSFFEQGDTHSKGLLINSRVSYDLKLLKLTLSSALFNTDDFNNRQYIYESNFPYSLSIPFYQGIGYRWYAMARLKIVSGLSLWVRIAQTRLRYVSQIGSGLDTIQGNKRTDISAQIRYKL